MTDLKPYYDAAFKADEEVKRITTEMDAAFLEGTPEGKQKALELRPALDEAKQKAKEANQLYVTRRDASLTDESMASLFSAPSDLNSTDQPDAPQGPKVIKRKEFHALNAAARMAFMKSGGTVED